MECIKCLADMPEGTAYCWSCGTKQPKAPEVTQAPAPPPPPQAYAPPPPYPPPPPYAQAPYAQPGYAPYLQMPHPYKKNGGWILFLQVLMIISMAFWVYSLISDFISLVSTWDVASFASSMLSNAVTLAGFLPIIQLLRRDAKFLQNYHIVFFISLAVSIVSYILPLLSGVDAISYIFEEYLGIGELGPILYVAFIAAALIFSVLWFVIWRTYFTRSVRVRTYMGTDSYMTQCIFCRDEVPPLPAAPDDPPPAYTPYQ